MNTNRQSQSLHSYWLTILYWMVNVLISWGSAHGIYNEIGALHLAKAIRNKNKIVLAQPGFIHLQAKFIHQVEYELAIASHYIGWGGGRQASNIYRLGSMYSSRPFDALDCGDNALVLLPQILEQYRDHFRITGATHK